jgi:phospholipase/lecithinase/hemolysin
MMNLKLKMSIPSIRSLLVSVVCITFSSISISAPLFSNIYVFGDSLSDTGNTRATVPFGGNGTVATIAGYGSNGRFSNGPLWHEELSSQLGVSAASRSTAGGNNYAYGGARVDNATGVSAGMFTQEAAYSSSLVGSSDPDALFIAWFGGNDMRDLVANANPVSAIENTLDNLLGFLGGLIDSGVNNLLVPNLPDLGSIPEFRAGANAASANLVSTTWNFGLKQRLQTLVNTTSADIFFLDVFSTFNDILNNPAASGFTNTTDECRSVNSSFFGLIQTEVSCAGAAGYVFWDEIHPTTAAHRLLGQSAFDLLASGNSLQRVSAPYAFSFLLIALGYIAFVRRATFAK